MTNEAVPFDLTPREIELILKYGCPFPQEAELLRKCTAKTGWHAVRIDPYYLSMWTADLIRSAKALRSRSLLDELDALCSVLEHAEQRGERVR